MKAPETSPPQEPIASLKQRRLGRYDVRYLVAQGGMASVYLAELLSGEGFKKWVALKTIHPTIATDPRFVQMFMNEARLVARLDHPNICTVFDFGETDGIYFLAMEYLHGESLQAVSRYAWRNGRGLPVGQIARIIADAARGLHAAHELQTEDGHPGRVVHRDISPQNLFVLYSGVTKVVDFGIARSSDSLGEGTATGEIKGKLAYMSPQQIKAGDVDRRADIWSLGVVLWEATLGRRLFRRSTEPTTMYAVLEDDIPKPSSILRDYPPELEAIVMRALERDPSRRYETALQMARELEAFIVSTGAPAGADEVGETMSSLFAAQIAARNELLRRHVADDDSPPERVSLSPDDVSGGSSGPSVKWDEASASGLKSAVTPAEQVFLLVESPSAVAAAGVASTKVEFRRSPQDAGSNAVAAAVVSTARATRHRPARRDRRALPWIALLIGIVSSGAASGWWLQRADRLRDNARQAADTTASSLRVEPTMPSVVPPVPAVEIAPPEPTPIEPIAAPPVALPVVAPPEIVPVEIAPPVITAPLRVAVADHHAPHGHGLANEPPAEQAGEGEPFGALSVYSSDRGEVFEGARSLGTTPLVELRMPVGNHTLRVAWSDGSETVNVDIRSLATSMLSLHRR